MDLPGLLFLCYVEEDNPPRGHFRIRPIYTIDTQTPFPDTITFKDDGYLRVVPDKNQQLTFKSRMRQQGRFCLLDLRAVRPEVSKIRTNKNYNPSRLETNRLIVYSDVLKPVPDEWLTEVVELPAEGGLAAAFAATTSNSLYIAAHGAFYGPVGRGEADLPTQPTALSKDDLLEEQQEKNGYRLAIHRSALPTITPGATYPLPALDKPFQPHGSEAASAPIEPKCAPEPDPKQACMADAETAIPVGKRLEILDSSRTFEEHLQDITRPLSQDANLLSAEPNMPISPDEPAPRLNGTPLMRSVQQPTVAPRVKGRNQLNVVVEQQWRTVRYEAPGSTLMEGAALRDVENPIDAVRSALSAAWRQQQIQPQLVDLILSMPGMPSLIDRQLHRSVNDAPAVQAMRQQLVTLEAERLELLMESKRLKNAREEQRKQFLEEMGLEAAKKLRGLENKLDAIKFVLERTTERLREAQAREALTSDMPRAVTGHELEAPAILTQVTAQFALAGLKLPPALAASYLTALTCDGRLTIFCPQPARARQCAIALAAGLGLPSCAVLSDQACEQQTPAIPNPSPTPLLAIDLDFPNLPNVLHVYCEEHGEAADMACFPAASACAATAEVTPALPVSHTALQTEFTGAAPVQEIVRYIDSLLSALEPYIALPADLRERVIRYMGAASRVMPGGAADAMDTGLIGYVLPLLHETEPGQNVLRDHAASMPRTLDMLTSIAQGRG